VKTAHHTATESSASLTGSVACASLSPSPDGSPNHSGCWIQARFSSRHSPPPR
jgi:hypothetical protein